MVFSNSSYEKCIHNLINACGFIHGFNVTVALLFEKILKKKNYFDILKFLWVCFITNPVNHLHLPLNTDQIFCSSQKGWLVRIHWWTWNNIRTGVRMELRTQIWISALLLRIHVISVFPKTTKSCCTHCKVRLARSINTLLIWTLFQQVEDYGGGQEDGKW